VNDLGIVAAQEQDDARDILGLRPVRKVRAGHCLPICFAIDDVGRIEFTRTLLPLKSAASESIKATAAAFDAA
jgi:hypothetical protein